MLNPYASCLADRDALAVIASTADQLTRMSALPARQSAPGKWDVRQIVCHLADCEIAFGFRLRQAVAEQHHVIQPFDQDLWAGPYAAFQTKEALDVFRSLRRWNIRFIGSQGAEVFAKLITHPERGTMTFRTLVETMAGHDLNHIQQVAALTAS